MSGYPHSHVEDVTGALNNLDQRDYGIAEHYQYLLFFVKRCQPASTGTKSSRLSALGENYSTVSWYLKVLKYWEYVVLFSTDGKVERGTEYM